MSDAMADRLKYSYVSRKVFDNTVDKLKAVNGRQKADIKDLRNRLRQIEEFLEIGPHGHAWVGFLATKK